MAVNVLVFCVLYPDRGAVLSAMGLTPDRPTMNSILSSMFLHADVIHLAWNMLFLWLFGPNVEDALGRLEYAIFYFGSGFAASLLHVVAICALIPMAGDIPMVGASGAIAGILGVFAIRFYKTRIRIWYLVFLIFFVRWGKFTIPAWIGLGIWFVQQLIGGLLGVVDPQSGGVAYWSHIGGMIFGMVLAYSLRMGLDGTKEYLRVDAKASLEKGTAHDAAASLQAVLQHEPDNADVHGELASAYAAQQDEERALAHYQRSIDLHFRRGEPDKAVARFAELKHHYRSAHLELKFEYQLARHLLGAGHHAPALQLLEDIASAYPGTPEAEVAAMKAGDIYLNSLGDPRSALQCYERFLRDYPHSTYRAMVEKSAAAARRRI